MKEVENRTERIAKRIIAMARFGYYGAFDSLYIHTT